MKCDDRTSGKPALHAPKFLTYHLTPVTDQCAPKMTIASLCEDIGLRGLLEKRLSDHTRSYLTRRTANLPIASDDTLTKFASDFLNSGGGVEHFADEGPSHLKWTNNSHKLRIKETVTEIMKLQRKHAIETLHRKGTCPGCVFHGVSDSPERTAGGRPTNS